MTDGYFSLRGEYETQKVIEKSRFITTSAHVEGEEQAKSFIAAVGAKYRDATHNCYAFISDTLGNFMRFSDDGEPQGTAGMPILEVIKNNRLVQTAIVVTRYFGGIKLGAGGLLRAYSGSAAENVAAACKVLWQPCAELSCTVDYSLAESCTRFISERGAQLINTNFSDSVNYIVAVKKSEAELFKSELVNRLNGRVKIQIVKEYFSPFNCG